MFGNISTHNAVGEVKFGLDHPNLCKKKISYKKLAAYGDSRSSLHPSKVKYLIKLPQFLDNMLFNTYSTGGIHFDGKVKG